MCASPHTFLGLGLSVVHVGRTTVETYLGLADSLIESLLFFLLA
jgi:hypothetical protein